jgi:hypothetical protein
LACDASNFWRGVRDVPAKIARTWELGLTDSVRLKMSVLSEACLQCRMSGGRARSKASFRSRNERPRAKNYSCQKVTTSADTCGATHTSFDLRNVDGRRGRRLTQAEKSVQALAAPLKSRDKRVKRMELPRSFRKLWFTIRTGSVIRGWMDPLPYQSRLLAEEPSLLPREVRFSPRACSSEADRLRFRLRIQRLMQLHQPLGAAVNSTSAGTRTYTTHHPCIARSIRFPSGSRALYSAS